MEIIINEIMQALEISNIQYLYIILGIIAIVSICCVLKR